MTEPLCFPGMVFLTRNPASVGNDSPGFWNHTAVCVANDWVIEGQRQPGRVIAVPFLNFYARYPEILAIRILPVSLEVRFGEAAADLLGYRYLPLRFNCVGVVRDAVARVTGRRPKWRKPDDVFLANWEQVWRKKDYETYEAPAEFLQGMTVNPRDLLEKPKCSA